MLSEKVIYAIQNSWGQDTCYPGDSSRWSLHDPSVGQCAVTALLVQDLIEGEICLSAQYNHYWNLVEGEKIDLTLKQFGEKGSDIGVGVVIGRSEILESPGAVQARTMERYQLLRKRFQDFIKG